jgi:hypothetical protein
MSAPTAPKVSVAPHLGLEGHPFDMLKGKVRAMGYALAPLVVSGKLQ